MSAGICEPHERAQPGAGTSPRKGRGDIRAQGGEKQYTGKVWIVFID